MFENANVYLHRHHHVGDPHLHHCSSQDMKSDALWKSISIVSIYIIGMFFCVLPIVLRRRFSQSQHYTTYLGVANSFAAGIFLSLGLIHLLPEGEERLVEYYGAEKNHKFKFCYVMCAVGYAFILMLERIVFTTPTCAHHMHKKVHMEDAMHMSKHSARDVGDLTSVLLPKGQSSTPVGKHLGAGISPENIYTPVGGAEESPETMLNIQSPSLEDTCAQSKIQPCNAEGSHIVLRNTERIVAAMLNETDQCAVCEHERRASPLNVAMPPLSDDKGAILENPPMSLEETPDPRKSGRLTQESLSALSSSFRHGRSITSSLALDGSSELQEADGHNQLKSTHSFCASVVSAAHELHKAPHASRNNVQPYVLMAALSAHGLSEGLALGVERGTRNIMLLFVGILAHKWAEGLALGISFSQTSLETRRVIGLLLAFSLSTPVGICVGWLAQALLPGCAEGYFLGFSSGSFLYIGASEVVVDEFIQGKRQWGKFSSFLGGVVLIYLISIFLEA